MTTPRTGSSKARYREFVKQYAARTLGEDVSKDVAKHGAKDSKPGTKRWRVRLLARRRGDYLRDYLRWLAPHKKRLAVVCVLALLSAGAQSVEPLFMRYIVDRVLLSDTPVADRVWRLNAAGAAFLALVVLSAGITVLKDYTQRILNVRVVLSLRRAIFDRFMHLPLPGHGPTKCDPTR
jgi:ATP-binding cassette subfamily B protein/subfamily B ATP-binding cassette protein MsbA